MAGTAGVKRPRPLSNFSNILRSLLQTPEEHIVPLEFKRTKEKRLIEESKQVRHKANDSAAARREWDLSNQVLPDSLSLEFERKLRKTATRGVVALFNAVQQHQRKAAVDVTGEKSDKAALSKSGFLDLLKRGTQHDAPVQKNTAQGGWDALRDDFMSGKGRSRLRNFDGEASAVYEEEEKVEEEAEELEREELESEDDYEVE